MQIPKEKKRFIISLIVLIGLIFAVVLIVHFNRIRVIPEEREDLVDEEFVAYDVIYGVSGIVKSIEDQKIVIEVQENIFPDFVPETLTIRLIQEGKIIRREKATINQIKEGKKIMAFSIEDMKESVKGQGEFVANFIEVGQVDAFLLEEDDDLVPAEEALIPDLFVVSGTVKSIEDQKIVIRVQENIFPDFVPETLTIRLIQAAEIIRAEQITIAEIVIGKAIMASSMKDMRETIEKRKEFIADLISIEGLEF